MAGDHGENFRRLAHAPLAFLAAGHFTARGSDECDAALLQCLNIRLRCRILPHHDVHCRREHHRLVGGEQNGGSEIVGDPLRHFGDQIGAGRGDDDQIGFAAQAEYAPSGRSSVSDHRSE